FSRDWSSDVCSSDLEEIAVWARFCRFVSRKRWNPQIPARPMSMATSAPMTEVFAEMPSVVTRCRPMKAPSTDRTTVTTRVRGAKALGWDGAAVDGDRVVSCDMVVSRFLRAGGGARGSGAEGLPDPSGAGEDRGDGLVRGPAQVLGGPEDADGAEDRAVAQHGCGDRHDAGVELALGDGVAVLAHLLVAGAQVGHRLLLRLVAVG